MKIRLKRIPFFGKDCSLKEGMEFDTVSVPVKHARTYMTKGFWIEHEGKPYKFFKDEIELLSSEDAIENEKYQLRKSVFQGSMKASSKEELDIILDKSDISYNAFVKEFEKTCFLHENKVYTPYAVVIDYGYVDDYGNKNISIDNHKLGERASFYAKEGDIIANVKYWDKKVNVIFKELYIPYELFSSSSPQDAIDGWVNFYPNCSLNLSGFSAYSQENDDYESEPEIRSVYEEGNEQIEEDSLKLEILVKNQNKFLDMKIYDKDYKIPLYPFFLWIAPSYSALHSQIPLYTSIYGHSVCNSGMKMHGDSSLHNDWVIGAGIDIDEYYNILNDKESGLSSEIYRLTKLLLKGVSTDFQILNKKSNEQDILFLDIGDKPGETVFVNSEEDLLRALKTAEVGGIVMTENSTEVAHIVNNALELDFTLLNAKINQTQMMVDYNFIADLTTNKIYSFSNKGILLSTLEDGNSKAHRLAILKRAGFNVLEGLYFDEPAEFKNNSGIELIFRSSGEGRNASGIFKSIITRNDYQLAFNGVFDSFSSELALQYKKMSKKDIKPAVLVQPFLKADESAVVSSLGSAYCIGDASLIVQGADGVLKDAPSEYIDLYIKISVIFPDAEVEMLKKNGVIYILQA